MASNLWIPTIKYNIRTFLIKLRVDKPLLFILRAKLNFGKKRLYLFTETPVATLSDDHLHPVGATHDNYANPFFISELLEQLPSFKSFCDLGCAGGQLVVELQRQGIFAVGIEGSPKALLGSGWRNWLKGYGSFLFFADITKEFKLSESGLATTFDVIHSEEVFEHLTEAEVITTLRNIKSLMKDESILLLGISLHDDCREIRGGKSVNLHKTVRTGLWWESTLANNGFELMPTIFVDKNVYGWPVATSNRSNFSDSVFFGVKKASC